MFHGIFATPSEFENLQAHFDLEKYTIIAPHIPLFTTLQGSKISANYCMEKLKKKYSPMFGNFETLSIIGMSFGGLVAKQMVSLGITRIAKKCKSLILLGVPHLGISMDRSWLGLFRYYCTYLLWDVGKELRFRFDTTSLGFEELSQMFAKRQNYFLSSGDLMVPKESSQWGTSEDELKQEVFAIPMGSDLHWNHKCVVKRETIRWDFYLIEFRGWSPVKHGNLIGKHANRWYLTPYSNDVNDLLRYLHKQVDEII